MLETQGDTTVGSHQGSSERRAAEHQVHLENGSEQSPQVERREDQGEEASPASGESAQRTAELTPSPPLPGPNKPVWGRRRCPAS